MSMYSGNFQNICEHAAECKEHHIYVADQNKWTIIDQRMNTIWDVVGWMYCPREESSQAMVTTSFGVVPYHYFDPFFSKVFERWPGVQFGGRRGRERDDSMIPEDIRSRVRKMEDDWYRSVVLVDPLELAPIRNTTKKEA